MAKSSKHQNQEPPQATMWRQWAWLAGGCATVIITVAKSVILTLGRQSNYSRPWIDLFCANMVGYIVADLGTGIYHWAIDNYGSPTTPIFGPQIVGFQGHHRLPAALGMAPVAKNLYRLAAGVTVVVLPINVLSGDPIVLGFFGSLGGFVVLSQQFHAWAHTPRPKLPAAVVALQDAGIILGIAGHAVHHRPPFDSGYCTVNGVWNRFLDRSGFFRMLEAAVFAAFGARPRSWSDPSSDEWTAEIVY